MTTSKPRLSTKDWIAAGFRSLVTKGPEALKAEPLARELGTTKGSFYWHFKDVPDFKTKMLQHWQGAVIQALSAAVDAGGTAAQRLYRINEISSTEAGNFGGAALEPAIRAWAQSDAEVAAAVEEIDAKRLAYLGATLKQLDLTNPEFARILYGAFIGMGTLSATDGQDNTDALSTLTAAMLALQDA
ncbi:MAG: TetR/AcrR family transcriptional regulator [Maritimibacter harenae]